MRLPHETPLLTGFHIFGIWENTYSAIFLAKYPITAASGGHKQNSPAEVRGCWGVCLAAKTEALDQFLIARDIFLRQITKQFAAFVDHGEQTAA